MSSSTGCCLVLLHNSSFEILSGQGILMIFLRQVLMKTCYFLNGGISASPGLGSIEE
ncbi:hypothetical protein DPMN_051902 [Dreissena polymorpha]|uniref:Uncharacterized protein n=1 Tax=Dreissena polymorpha TaxID=45954 RepID=A0A9D4CJF1_DREPO|nr:hypothetical protein DPMN_051902 [Dreissena polymorpha]